MKKILCLSTDDTASWDSYTANRLIRKHPAGFSIIVPKERDAPIPLFCPVCQCCIVSPEDIHQQSTRGACEHCIEKWYYPNADKWNLGWRPGINECHFKRTVTVGQ